MADLAALIAAHLAQFRVHIIQPVEPVRQSLAGPDGKTMHVRFDDTHGHVQEQDGHKVE
jgi:hypothetical protein